MFIRQSQNKEQSIHTYFIKASNKQLGCFLNCYVFKWCLLNVEGFYHWISLRKDKLVQVTLFKN